jgi:hypothetical protein
MTNVDVEKLSRPLPKEIAEILKGIPPILMEDYKQEGLEIGLAKGKAEGEAEKVYAFTLKTIRKFPDWSDTEVADFVETTVEYVGRVRKELNA